MMKLLIRGEIRGICVRGNAKITMNKVWMWTITCGLNRGLKFSHS